MFFLYSAFFVFIDHVNAKLEFLHEYKTNTILQDSIHLYAAFEQKK